MASKSQRAVALMIAVLFLVTSIGFSGVVIWQIMQEGKQESAHQSPEANNQESEGAKLEGTKLAGFTPVEKVDQLQSTDLTVGTGEEVKPGATVTAHYTGALTKDGTIFQSSHDQPGDQPVEFALSGVIKGWTDGVPGMKVGGKRRLLIPAAQAYGDQSPSPTIPPNSDLVFDIEMVSVKNP